MTNFTNFPLTPVDGSTITVHGQDYVWSNETQTWLPFSTESNGARASVPTVLQSDWVQITNAQMLALRDGNTLVIPGVAGKVLVPIQFVLYAKTLAGAYTHNSAGDYICLTALLQSGFDITGVASIDADAFCTIVTASDLGMDSFTPAPAVGFYSSITSADVGVGLYLTMVGQVDLGGGDAGNEVYCKVWYTEMELPA